MKYKIGLIILLTLAFTSCASTVPETKYMPKESDNVFPFFTSGQPIAAVQSVNEFMLLSVDQTKLANKPYFRLWILYQNISEKPYLLEPLNFVTINITSTNKGDMGIINPESPTKILADISNKKALTMTMQAIGGALQSMATKSTSANTEFNDGSSATTTFNDRQEKQNAVADRTANAMSNTAMWYDIYQNSISDGILRRNTVFPGRSVNGYIYFPYPRQWDFYDKFDESIIPDVLQLLTVKVALAGDSLNITFIPIEGE